MKFRIRKRKRAAANQATIAQRPPQVITVNNAAVDNPYEEEEQDRTNNCTEPPYVLQKLFARHLFRISSKHLGDNHNRQLIRRRHSLVDASASTTGDTSVLRPEDNQFLSGQPIHRPKPKPSFRITCGTNDSGGGVTSPPRRSAAHALLASGQGKCSDLPVALGCTDPPVQEDAQKEAIPAFATPCSFWCDPIMSFFPDSCCSELNNDGFVDTPPPHNNKATASLSLLSIFFGKRPNTKRNGIPRVITVVNKDRPSRRPLGCCGAMPPDDDEFGNGSLREYRKEKDQNCRTFDTSLVRLEESLMRANLEEEKFSKPTHFGFFEQPHHDHQDRTATPSSVTSSISTHSSLKFGASIVKLPAAMASPVVSVPFHQ